MAMINMQLDAQEARELYGEVAMPADSSDAGDAPKYPYGLEIQLNDASLKKLGLAAPPEVGAAMTLTARVVVTSARTEQRQDGNTDSRSDMQITDMELQPEAAPTPAQALYGASGMGR